jgi:hypothetical protein
MAFTKNGKTQIRYMSYNAADIAEMVPDDTKFPESLAETFAKIKSMINEAK